jgi:hypothetical protein
MRSILNNLQEIHKNTPAILTVTFLFINAFFNCATVVSAQDINTLLMESTFKIAGISKQDATKAIVGTMFLVGIPIKANPTQSYIVMVTAAHVLDEIAGDDATVFLRKRAADGALRKVPFTIKIRDKGNPLFVRHDSADVVAMYLSLPNDIISNLKLIPTNLLANDKVFEKYEIHPGDELLCLGYPFLAESNEAGFPILRSGKIASYPLIPAKTVKTFLFDFTVFEGNSGGPVYMDYNGRIYQNINHIGEIVQYIAGLVSQQANALPEYNNQSLELAVVVPAQFIEETIKLLPDNDLNPENKKN